MSDTEKDEQWSTERFAMDVIRAHLDAHVTLHDDGSRPRMYDIHVVKGNGGTAAVEVKEATDALFRMSWSGSKHEVTLAGLQSGYQIGWEPGFKLKTALPALGRILPQLEVSQTGREVIHVDHYDNPWSKEMAAQRIAIILKSNVSDPGELWLSPFSLPHGVDQSGKDIPAFIENFLAAHPKIVENLSLANTDERELFIVIDQFSPSLPHIRSSFSEDWIELPPPIVLPTPMTGVWLASAPTLWVLYWANGRWERFRAPMPPEDCSK